MSLVDDLRSLRGSGQVTLHDFLLNIRSGRDFCIHAFYEGKNDNGFYGAMIRRLVKEDVVLKTYVCGNKNEVYNTRSKFSNRSFEKDKLVFFVDKDVDDIIPLCRPLFDDLHVTETYSIENYLVDEKMFSQVCSEVMKIDSGCERLNHIEVAFKKCDEKFSEWMIDVMAWVICCRRLNCRPKLGNVKMDDICQVDGDMNFSPLKSGSDLFSYLSETSGANVSIMEDYIKSAVEELKRLPPKSYIRGKFHLWLLVECIDKAKSALAEASEKDLKVHVNLNCASIVDILAPRLRTPQTIIAFFQRNCEKALLVAA